MENENEIKPVYYDGTKLLSMKDINNKTPEIYLSTGNRTSGKTTYFNRLAMNRFLKQGKKFGLLYRFNYELDSISDKFFKDIKSLFFQEWNMVSVSQARGIYHKIYLTKGDIEDKKAERIEEISRQTKESVNDSVKRVFESQFPNQDEAFRNNMMAGLMSNPDALSKLATTLPELQKAVDELNKK